jgi:hypothetical protein
MSLAEILRFASLENAEDQEPATAPIGREAGRECRALNVPRSSLAESYRERHYFGAPDTSGEVAETASAIPFAATTLVRGGADLEKVIRKACAPIDSPGRDAASSTQRSPEPTSIAPIAAAPLPSLALPTPLAPISDYDRGVDEAWRLPSFASPPATQSLAASPAPLAPISDYDRGAEGARRLRALTGAASVAAPPRSSPAHSAPLAPPARGASAATSQLTDYEKGAAEARELLGKTACASRSSPAHPAPPAPDVIAATSQLADYEKGAAEARKLLGKTA